MEKRHLAFQWPFNELIIALPGQCALLCFQANWQWTPNGVQKCVIGPAIDKGAATPLLMALGVGTGKLTVNVPHSVLTLLPTLATIHDRSELAATLPVRADKAIER
jgi:hypothetical protein